MQNEQAESIWEALAPLLDQAMTQLGETDRNALVLRYFENKTSREVGEALGINEGAAQKRLARAVEKLRAICFKRGVVASAIGLTALISVNSVQAAPAGVVAATSAAVKGAGVATSTAALVKGTLALMRWIKIKMALSLGLGTAAVAGTALLIEVPDWSSQPSVEGQTLHTWMARLDHNKLDNSIEMPWVSWQQIVAGRTAEEKKAAEAIRSMGENALPYLRKVLAKTDGRVDRLSEKLGWKDLPATRRHRAALALDALGPAAKPLLPQLAECLEGTNCPKEAAMALAAIGPEGWEVLTKAVTSSNNAAAPCSIWVLGTHRVATPETFVALKGVLTNPPMPGLDAQAAWALAEIGQDRAELVPMLIEGLKARREDMRWACALALGELGPVAHDAIPALVENLHDKSPRVRQDAAQALQEIDLTAAAQAGVGQPLAEHHVPKTRIY
jgi:hypothetical protein